MKEIKCESIHMYVVKPNWGTKKLRIVKKRVLRRGKTLFMRMPNAQKRRSWVSTVGMYFTEREALEARLKEVTAESDMDAEYSRNRKKDIAAVKSLLKEYK